MKPHKWWLGALATALLVAGSLVAFPGESGRHLAGLVLLNAWLVVAGQLLYDKEK